MLIEHDGKTIDTEREIRRRDSHEEVRYVGSLKVGKHIFEWGRDCWKAFTSKGSVTCFENVPQKQQRWVNVYPEGATLHASEELADQAAMSFRIACCRIEWES